jgi:hypothetical protein
MAFDPIALTFSVALGAASPGAPDASTTPLAGLGLDHDRIGAEIDAGPTVTTAFLATSCKDKIIKMSGIQFVTCLIAYPDDLFGPGEEEGD